MPKRPHVVIIGGGFGGLTAARKLKDANVDVTIVDRTNHHLFQPLLYQVAMASLAPTDITTPIRYLVRKQQNTVVVLGNVCKIDVDARIVYLDDEQSPLSYDYLIVAAGARHSYFGHPEWETFAPGLKAIDDATEIRSRFLLAFEKAEQATTEEERTAWMTFVIIGGGPTGVELAGIMQDIAGKALRRDFRHIDTYETKVILVEAGPRILSAFPESLSARATRDLQNLRVDVRLGSTVTHVDANGVSIGEQHIPTHTVIWAAGNSASPLGAMLGVPVTKSGQVIVDRDLSIPGHPEVFVVGDLAYAIQRDGNPAPGVAQVAMQGGRVAARNIIATIAQQPRRPFNYLNKGDLATIGRAKAIANLFGGRITVSGFIAWFIWLFIHIMYLAGFRNRLSVLLQWGYAYFTYQRGARLIVWHASQTVHHPSEIADAETKYPRSQ